MRFLPKCVDLFVGLELLFVFSSVPAFCFGGSASCSKNMDHPDIGPSIGWYFDSSLIWKPAHSPLHSDAAVVTATDYVRFVTKQSPASWALTVEPIWIDPFSSCRFSYRAGGLWEQAERVILVRSGATGPVTPGAKNPENPLAVRGEAVVLSGDELIADGRWHEVTVDLASLLDTHQIDQIVVEIHPRRNARLEMKQLRFEAPALERLPGEGTVSRAPTSDETSLKEMCSEWVPISIPKGSTRWNDLKALFNLTEDFSAPTEWVVYGVPFCPPARDARIASTVLWDEDHLEIPVRGRACEVAILLGCRLFGTDSAWKFRRRAEIHQPERFTITLRYEDGASFQAFPWQIASKEFRVSEGIDVYVIPSDPRKALSSLVLNERMSYGQLFLLALSAHRSGKRIGPGLQAMSAPKPICKTKTGAVHDQKRVSSRNESVTIHDGLLEMELPSVGELRVLDLRHLPLACSLLRNASDRRLFTLYRGGREISSASFSIRNLAISSEERSAKLSCRSEETQIDVEATFSINTDHGISLDLNILNWGDGECDLKVVSPDLRGLRLSSLLADDFYCFPVQAAVISSEPADLAADYGGRFPLQFIDLFARGGGGLYLLTQDRTIREKRYGLRKGDRGTDIRVEHGRYVPIELGPGESWCAPRTIFGGHLGDWHDALAAYRSWAKSWQSSRPASRDWIRDVWICRRDYPLGGTGYLLDEAKNRYTFSALIQESEEELGGIDLIDISGWAYMEARGRVGDYDCSELGGLRNLREQIAVGHELGVQTGLYLEGYLVDERSRVIETVGDAWQLVGADGEKRFWPGNREMFMCPAVMEWQDYFSRVYRRVAEEIGADALYVDQFGFADRGKACYSDRHGHTLGQSPLIGEDAMLRRIRAALDACRPEVALYTEEVPCDLTSSLVDAAFCYGMYHASSDSHPTKLNLFRYAFPEFKIIELFVPGIHPRASSEEDAKLAFFHGHAVWLKGRAASWYSRSFREFVRKSHEIRRQYSRAFSSEDCEPLVPTLIPGVYANRFSDGSVTIYTLYNSLYYSVDEPSIAIPIEEGQHVVDLWGGTQAEMEEHEGLVLVRSALPPHGVGCLAVPAN